MRTAECDAGSQKRILPKSHIPLPDPQISAVSIIRPQTLHVRPCAVLCRFPINHPTAIPRAQIAYSADRVNRNIAANFSLVGTAVFTLFRRFSQGQQQEEKTHHFCRHCRHERHRSTALVSFGYRCFASSRTAHPAPTAAVRFAESFLKQHSEYTFSLCAD